MDKVDKQIEANRDSSKATLILVATLLVSIFLIPTIYNSFLCDDAFITFRFAKHLAAGIGPIYNTGEHVEGYTNFLWMILMALVIKLGGAPQIWSRIISICFSLGTLAIFLNHIYSNRDHKNILGYLFAFFLVLSSPFIAWSTGGLETAAFAFFLFAALILFRDAFQSDERARFALSSTIFALAALTRPEGVFVFGLAFIFLMVSIPFKKASIRQFIPFILPFLIIFGIYFIWRFSYYGKLFPNTFYIKEPSTILIPLGIQYYRRFLIGYPIWLPLLLAIYASIKSRFYGLAYGDYFLAIVFIAYSIYVIYAGGDFMDLWRFLMPLLAPFFLLLHHLCLDKNPYPHKTPQIILSAIVLVVFAGFNFNAILQNQEISYENNVDSVGALRKYVTQWTSVGKLLTEIGQPTDTIAVTAAGMMPYYSDMYTIDMYGLEAADLTKYGKLTEFTRPGHRMTISLKYLYDSKPHFMIAHPQITLGQPRYFPYSQTQDLYPTLIKEYTAVSIALPDLPGYYLNCRIRNDVVGRISKDLRIYKVDYWSQ